MAEATEQDTTIRRQEIGYKYSLNMQEMICGEALTNLGASQNLLQYNSAMNYLIAALDALEDKLSPYHDKGYKEDKYGKPDKRKKKKIGGFVYIALSSKKLGSMKASLEAIEETDPETVNKNVEVARLDALRKQQRERYAALLRLMDRKNLLLEEEAEDHAGPE